MQLQAGTVIGGMIEVRRPETPRSARPLRTGSSSRQRSRTSDGSAQSSPTIRTRLAADTVTPLHLLGEDLRERGAFGVAGDLLLGRVLLGDREPVSGAELLRDRAHPVHEPLEAGARGHRLAAREIDELAGEAVPDRAPDVLLDETRRRLGQRLALVESARKPRGEGVTERREGAGLGDARLRVADPDLDGREDEVRPDAPPDLRVLGDRARLVEEPDVRLPLVPA